MLYLCLIEVGGGGGEGREIVLQQHSDHKVI